MKLKSVEAAAMLFKVFVAIVVQFAFNVYVQRNAEVGKYIHLNAEASSDSFDQDISFIQVYLLKCLSMFRKQSHCSQQSDSLSGDNLMLHLKEHLSISNICKGKCDFENSSKSCQ